MCSQCGDRDPRRRFAVEGSDRLLCRFCIRDEIAIAWSHEQIRRIHRAAHGHDDPCPICLEDAWLTNQLTLEQLEQSIARAQADLR